MFGKGLAGSKGPVSEREKALAKEDEVLREDRKIYGRNAASHKAESKRADEKREAAESKAAALMEEKAAWAKEKAEWTSKEAAWAEEKAELENKVKKAEASELQWFYLYYDLHNRRVVKFLAEHPEAIGWDKRVAKNVDHKRRATWLAVAKGKKPKVTWH